ncbi:hypothetical protein F5148DRAFT_1192296 [Russula earlei]|uniref:Uncharacterized protein n=1 Tax=Russula earlei TaxID=71964 RepID=A0ACC0UAU6_9AGAM|nr:hypothetical protein F5148DRAFT_1192296 [Russula earlei]
MGNSASSSSFRVHHEDTVDFGHLTPQGVYSGNKDWKEDVVTQLIIDRKIAPFYRPLEDYEISWDDDQILAARKEPPAPVDNDGSGSRNDAPPHSSKSTHTKRPSISKELPRGAEAAIYRDAIECPICFLYYPPNINHSRCCDQAICSECFVQIKRTEPTITHMVSDPACCPFCVQENFGVIYTPPPWRTGIGSEGWAHPTWPDSPKGSQRSFDSAKVRQGKQRRFKIYDHTDPDVVTVDQVHPDWEAKLAAVQAAAARRANRRIIMRQIGDRLIPVGITSGRIHPLSVDAAGAEGDGGGSRRSRRRQQQQQDLNSFLGNMGFGGRDLEELMMMEAMRLSLLEHEAQQRRDAEQRARDDAEDGGAQPRDEDRNPSPQPPPAAAEASSDVASSTAAPTLTPPVSSISPSSSAPNLSNFSPNHQPLSESPPDGSNDLDSMRQSSLSPVQRPPTVSRMDSLSSSVAPPENASGLEGYRFLTSESEESVVAREPLLHVEESDA